MRIWTIGHSTLPIDRFLATLDAHQIQVVADVRRFPGSRRHPHFAREPLQRALAEHGIDYLHLPELGGRRRARRDSPNTAWQSAAFRGYADHMDSPEFAIGIQRVLAAADGHRVAIMCAEAVWWQCHRGLIADFLKAHGHEVTHILTAAKTEPHPYTSAASIVDGQLSYRGLL
jgi:uncharacterized protein (DUF488 family)